MFRKMLVGAKVLRERFGLRKSGDKKEKNFLVALRRCVGFGGFRVGRGKPERTGFYCLVPLRFHRRQLHRMEPGEGGVRKPYGGTRSLGFKRGTLVRHPKWGLCYVGSHMGGWLSLHDLKTGKRLTQNAKPEECRILTSVSWRFYYVPAKVVS